MTGSRLLFLVAAVGQGVQRQRVLIGRGDFLSINTLMTRISDGLS